MNRAEAMILDLQQENQRLKAETKRMQQETKLTADQQYLLDLVSQMAEAWRPKFDVLPDGIQEIIRAYDKVESGERV